MRPAEPLERGVGEQMGRHGGRETGGPLSSGEKPADANAECERQELGQGDHQRIHPRRRNQ